MSTTTLLSKAIKRELRTRLFYGHNLKLIKHMAAWRKGSFMSVAVKLKYWLCKLDIISSCCNLAFKLF